MSIVQLLPTGRYSTPLHRERVQTVNNHTLHLDALERKIAELTARLAELEKKDDK